MKIGMIVAMSEEIDAMIAQMGVPLKTDSAYGVEIRQYSVSGNEIFVAGSGVGEIYAAAATQLLISSYGAEVIVNFGICGGLVPEMSLCSTVVVEKAVHYDFDTSAADGTETGSYPEYPDVYIPASKRLLELALSAEPGLRPVICASADKFVADPQKKAELNLKYGALICEMEAAGILLTANRSGVPALLIKAVSDSAEGGAEEFNKMARASAEVCVKTMFKILKEL